MHYISTRDKSAQVSSAGAIAMGLSREGGLFVPAALPVLPKNAIEELAGMSYPQRAVYIMRPFLSDYSVGEIADFAARAYGPSAFDDPNIAPVRELREGVSVLELWHGPTCAFKDMALQILPRLVTSAMAKYGAGKQVCVLTATSGDTGKAALEGFAGVEGTKVAVFYPEQGVSEIQRLQMVTQRGGNAGVFALRGNFDDAQSAVKAIFSDESLRQELSARGWILSSANSINWGRLLPQIVYYFSAYCDLLAARRIVPGERVNFCVPTGNFGDILAGWYAKRMGLPVGRLICASNSNNVLTDFINSGVYDRNRPLRKTISPSMDILVSSNLERLIFDLTGDHRETAGYMRELAERGRYEVRGGIKSRIAREFWADFCGDGETMDVIGRVHRDFGYLMDPHTAVACGVFEKYAAATGDGTYTVVLSTASPYKFCGSVLTALCHRPRDGGVELIGELERVSGTRAPASIAALATAVLRFTGSFDKSELRCVVRDFISD